MLSNMRLASSAFGICLLAAATTAVPCMAAYGAQFPSNEDLRHTRALAAPQLSPDAQSVLVQVSDSTADGARTHLWLVDIRANTSRQLTYSLEGEKQGEHNGEWAPDGGSIYFLAHRGAHSQLYRLPLSGGEAKVYDLKVAPPVDESRLPDAVPPSASKQPAETAPVEVDVSSYAVSPDGKTIAVLARDPQTPGEKKQQDEKADAVWVDHDPHGTRLYLLDAVSEKVTPAAVPIDVHGAVWSRQGKLMVSVDAPGNAGDLAPAASTWLLDPADPTHPQQMKSVPATAATPGAWSEDGKQYYFTAASQQDAPPGYSDLYALDLASGTVKDLSAGFNGTLEDRGLVALHEGVLARVQTGFRITAVRFAEGGPDTLRFETATVSGLATNPKQNGWVWIGSDSTHPETLFFADKLGRTAHPLNAPATTPALWADVPAQPIHWTNEGKTIEGLLYLPPEAKQHKVPMIVDVHGGPTGAFADRYDPLVLFLAGHGWAVLRTNPRGSTGYGAAFAAANKNDLGGADYRDIMAGVDAAIAANPIDPQKLGLMGYSYGGEMAAFVEGKTDRFKAIVAGAPVIDQESEYGTEDSSWYDRWFYGGRPWEHAADAWRQSPLSGVAKAKTPFLLLQGQGDKTDPPGQSEEMYRALRQMGVPVELVEYPREDHGPLAGGIFGNPSVEPWHGFDARQRIVAFFSKAFGK